MSWLQFIILILALWAGFYTIEKALEKIYDLIYDLFSNKTDEDEYF